MATVEVKVTGETVMVPFEMMVVEVTGQVVVIMVVTEVVLMIGVVCTSSVFVRGTVITVGILMVLVRVTGT